MAWYKMQQGQTEFLFQLVNMEVREDFSIWDNINKRFIRQVESVNNFDDLKFMKRELFAEKYPNYGKKTQFIREIIVNQGGISTQYSFGFGIEANRQINDEINNIVNLQRKDPLAFQFKFRKTGHGLSTISVVVAMGEVGKPINVQQSQYNPESSITAPKPIQQEIKPVTASNSPTQPNKVRFGMPNEHKIVVLNKGAETQIYEAACDYTKEGKLSEDRFVELWNLCARTEFNTIFEPARVKEIYKELYSKC
jgi:hypothetical protein